MQHDKTISTLEKLIETCRDGENGFREAAEHLQNTEARRFFLEQSEERARYASQLEQQALRLGHTGFDRSGSISGAVHRTWIDLKSKLGGGDEAIFAAAETGEDTAKDTYQEAINDPDLPEDIRGIIRQQAQTITAAHDRVKLFRDRLAA
jgi:uncharacterized protein (TIGR02284 family)